MRRTRVRRAPKAAIEKARNIWRISKKFNLILSHLSFFDGERDFFLFSTGFFGLVKCDSPFRSYFFCSPRIIKQNVKDTSRESNLPTIKSAAIEYIPPMADAMHSLGTEHAKEPILDDILRQARSIKKFIRKSRSAYTSKYHHLFSASLHVD